MFGDKKKYFGTTPRMLENAILGKKYLECDIVQYTYITTEKFFFFVYHKLGWDMEQKQINKLILVR